MKRSGSDSHARSTPAVDRHTPIYPIRTVVRFTGVHPGRIRDWERLYDLLNPVRTEEGHRLFSKHDVQRIRSIQAMVARGMRLKQIQRRISRPWKSR